MTLNQSFNPSAKDGIGELNNCLKLAKGIRSVNTFVGFAPGRKGSHGQRRPDRGPLPMKNRDGLG
jgi:hypothetical protein